MAGATTLGHGFGHPLRSDDLLGGGGVAGVDNILLESGDNILLESGDFLLKE